MSSYSYLGKAKMWTPREDEDMQDNHTEATEQLENTLLPHTWHTPSNYPSEKWSVKRLMRLLRLYGAHRCLWDTRDADNRNRKLRQAALLDITAAIGDGVSRAQVIQKINVLRATYRYEKRRIKQRIRRGIGAKTKLKWFALADAFLRHVPRNEKQRKHEDADTDSDLEDAVVFSIDPESLIPLEEEEECGDTLNLSQNREQTKVSSENRSDANNFEEFAEPASSERSNNVYVGKRKWTTHDSLQFIYLMRAYPLLWKLQSADLDQAVMECATAEIAQTMLLPVERVQKRLHIFLATYRTEMHKMQQDAKYKPNLVWWPMAQEYTATLNTTTDAQDPVKIKCEQDTQDTQDSQDVQLTNIQNFAAATFTPRQSPLSLAEHEYEGSVDSKDCQGYLHETAVLRKPPMKLIWNGLEDDLLEGKWSLKHSVKFLRLYGVHRCLWDLSDPDYRSRELRNAAIKDIAAAMGYGLDADYVAKKIKIFRITYMQHRKRMLEALKECREPEVQLRWFPLADSFLRPHIGLRSIKQHERELPQFDFQYVYANLNLIDPVLLSDINTNVSVNAIGRH